MSHFDTYSLREFTFNTAYFFEKGTGNSGVGGLALSSSLVFTLEFFFLVIVLYKRRVLGELDNVLKSIGKKFLAGTIMLVISYAMLKLWDQVLNTARTIPLLVLTSTTIASTVMLYIWTSFVLRIPEVELFINFIVRASRKILKR